MPLSVSYSLQVLHEIKKINSIKDFAERTDAFIFGKQKVHELINDELDELFSKVNLSDIVTRKVKEKKRSERLVAVINALSVILTKEEQSRHEYESLYSFMEEFFDTLYWYDRDMVILYLRVGNYRDMEKETKIPFTSCYRTVQRVIKLIRNAAIERFPDIEINEGKAEVNRNFY